MENNPTNCISKNGFKICSHLELSEIQIEKIVKLLSCPVVRKTRNLTGRVNMVVDEVEGLGKVIVKNYSRGGVFQDIIGNNHLNIGEIRPIAEFSILDFLSAKNLSVPRPIAVAKKGSLIYKGWLISEYIENKGTLVEIALSDHNAGRNYTEVLVEEIKKLVDLKILHLDLHPGNVIISSETDLPVIIDFDKAKFFKGSKTELRELYLRRWRRAVIKHNLPEILSEMMCLGLRTIN